MGGILSGSRGWRGGKASIARLPVVRLTHATTSSVAHRAAYVRVDGPDHCTVIHGLRNWPVMIDFTPLHFGGHRRWLVCPHCSSRREALYVSGDRLSCRQCLDLRYDSQHVNRRGRMFRRADKIRARLGWPPGVLAPELGKPDKMHWRTYLRLRAELDAMTNALLGCVNDWAQRAEERQDRQASAKRS